MSLMQKSRETDFVVAAQMFTACTLYLSGFSLERIDSVHLNTFLFVIGYVVEISSSIWLESGSLNDFSILPFNYNLLSSMYPPTYLFNHSY